MRHFTTCAHCFLEMAEVRVDLGKGPAMFVHRHCLEDWATASDGTWHADTTQTWASWLTGAFCRIVKARDKFSWMVFTSEGIQAHGKADNLLQAQMRAEKAAS